MFIILFISENWSLTKRKKQKRKFAIVSIWSNPKINKSYIEIRSISTKWERKVSDRHNLSKHKINLNFARTKLNRLNSRSSMLLEIRLIVYWSILVVWMLMSFYLRNLFVAEEDDEWSMKHLNLRIPLEIRSFYSCLMCLL